MENNIPFIVEKSETQIIKKPIFSFPKTKIINLLVILLLVAAIPLTVFMAQQQQELRQRAAGLPLTPVSPPSVSTPSLSIIPQSSTLTVGQTATFDIMVDPGTYQVSSVKLLLAYTNSHLATSSASPCRKSVCVNTTVFSSKVEGPVYTPGFISFSVTVQSNVLNGITTKTKVASLTLKAQPPHGVNPASIQFVTSNNQSQILTISNNTNVLASTIPAEVTIIEPSTPTPTVCTPCSADVTGNGKVTKNDYNQVAKKCYKKAPVKQCASSDIDKNGKIDLIDANCVNQQMNQRCNQRLLRSEPQDQN